MPKLKLRSFQRHDVSGATEKVSQWYIFWLHRTKVQYSLAIVIQFLISWVSEHLLVNVTHECTL